MKSCLMRSRETERLLERNFMRKKWKNWLKRTSILFLLVIMLAQTIGVYVYAEEVNKEENQEIKENIEVESIIENEKDIETDKDAEIDKDIESNKDAEVIEHVEMIKEEAIEEETVSQQQQEQYQESNITSKMVM